MIKVWLLIVIIFLFCFVGVVVSIGMVFNIVLVFFSFFRLWLLISIILGCILIMDFMDSGLYEVMEGEVGLWVLIRLIMVLGMVLLFVMLVVWFLCSNKNSIFLGFFGCLVCNVLICCWMFFFSFWVCCLVWVIWVIWLICVNKFCGVELLLIILIWILELCSCCNVVLGFILFELIRWVGLRVNKFLVVKWWW